MDERVRGILEQIAEKPPRSKLEPHLAVIQDLRRKKRTYHEIAEFLGEHLSLRVAPSTIHAFVKVRARRRPQRLQIELPTAPVMETAPAAWGLGTGAESKVRHSIEALKRRRPTEKVEKPKFEYNQDEPLRLKRTPETRHEG